MSAGQPIGGRDSGVESCVRVGKPLRAGVVEVRQRASLERLRGVLVAGNRTLGIAGNWLVHPVDPLGRIEPAVTQLDEPLGGLGNGAGARVTLVVVAGVFGVSPSGNGNVSKVVVGV